MESREETEGKKEERESITRENRAGAVDSTRLETKLHLLPFEFARSDTCVVQCFKTADYSNYRQRESIYAALWRRVKRHRPRCKVSLMLPRIISACMCACVSRAWTFARAAACGCGFKSAGAVDIRYPSRAPREIRKARPRDGRRDG